MPVSGVLLLTGLVPLVAGPGRIRAVGLVTLPGVRVGVPLGVAAPVLSGCVRLFVLVGPVLARVVAVAVVLELIARG